MTHPHQFTPASDGMRLDTFCGVPGCHVLYREGGRRVSAECNWRNRTAEGWQDQTVSYRS